MQIHTKLHDKIPKIRFNKTFRDVYYFIFSIDFYVYIRCRKFDAEFNRLIQTIGHRARFSRKNDVEPLPRILTLLGHCYLSSPKVVTKH